MVTRARPFDASPARARDKEDAADRNEGDHHDLVALGVSALARNDAKEVDVLVRTAGATSKASNSTWTCSSMTERPLDRRGGRR